MKYALALVLLAATSSMYDHEPDDFPVGAKAVRLLMVQGGWNIGDNAVFVDDPKEVQRLYDLLAGNSRVMYACGYHWKVIFTLADGRVFHLAINEECENFSKHNREINKLLHAYFDAAAKAPEHWRVRVGIAPRTDVASVRAALERGGYPAFALRPDWERKPTATFSVETIGEEAATKKLTWLVQRYVRQRHAEVVKEPTFAAMEQERYTVEAILVFPFGTTRADIEPLAGGTLKEFVVPSVYWLDVITKEPYTPDLERTLKAVDPRITAVERGIV